MIGDVTIVSASEHGIAPRPSAGNLVLSDPAQADAGCLTALHGTPEVNAAFLDGHAEKVSRHTMYTGGVYRYRNNLRTIVRTK